MESNNQDNDVVIIIKDYESLLVLRAETFEFFLEINKVYRNWQHFPNLPTLSLLSREISNKNNSP